MLLKPKPRDHLTPASATRARLVPAITELPDSICPVGGPAAGSA